MDHYDSARETIETIIQDVASLTEKAQCISGRKDDSFDPWQRICERVKEQINKDIIRIAVIGAIKSGKSTFVNSLLHKDYLKRGAGVVTSIVTRIRKGGADPKAILHFKSWDDVNNDVEHAAVMLPDFNLSAENARFDIRRQKDRADIFQALNQIKADRVMENGTFNAHSVLITNYLAGYEKVRDSVDSEDQKIEFSGERFVEHKTFVGDDALAVYLRDIQLEIDAELLNPTLEIADCQGSDSPNPLHLTMIQDYLVITHFIIYVISSRTGLRQADMRFLNMIKKMGILDHILFVVNCDLNEHDTSADLNLLVEKITQELSLIKPDPELFVFSSLFNLFRGGKPELNPKDRERLDQWEKLDDLVSKSNGESERFLEVFSSRILRDRFSLLLINHLEKLGVVGFAIKQWVALNRDFLTGDLAKAQKTMDRINQHQDKIRQIKMLIKDTLDGAVQKLISELKKELDQFFSEGHDGVAGAALEFVQGYQLNLSDYESKLETTGFNNTLYLVFQDFRQAVDRFMAESINPPIIKFLKEKEGRIMTFFKSVTTPYEKMILDSFEDDNQMLSALGGLPGSVNHGAATYGPDLDMIKRISGLKFPPADTTMRYSAKIKTDAFIRLSFYSALKMLKKLFKKPVENEREDAIAALKQSMVRMKKETVESIRYNFKNYRENIKFQYVLKLVEKVSEFMIGELGDRFQLYMTDLTRLSGLLDDKEISRKDALTLLSEMDLMADSILDRIHSARKNMETGA
ncbi:MAG: dynamin family protein [Proteobacteria bacterium]|nr:dynamin family protein [Pseudomonadota bacterium]